MLGAFYGGRYFTLEESLQECHEEFKDFARDGFSHYKITGINKKGLLAYPMEEGEESIPLLEQVESLDLPWDSKWNIYKCLTAYDTMLEELGALIRPVAVRMQSAMDDHSDLFQQIVGYWRGISPDMISMILWPAPWDWLRRIFPRKRTRLWSGWAGWPLASLTSIRVPVGKA